MSDQPLYTATVDPEFAELAEQFESPAADDRSPLAVRHRGDSVEGRKAAQLFG